MSIDTTNLTLSPISSILAWASSTAHVSILGSQKKSNRVKLTLLESSCSCGCDSSLSLSLSLRFVRFAEEVPVSCLGSTFVQIAFSFDPLCKHGAKFWWIHVESNTCFDDLNYMQSFLFSSKFVLKIENRCLEISFLLDFIWESGIIGQ